MARGWESKSIADQIEEKDERDQHEPHVGKDSEQARARRSKIKSLQLSRSRIVAQLEHATNDNHREMLNRALHSLEAEIAIETNKLNQS
ncbi:MAG: hypothetical protein NVSMB56_12460 [Pyrinomonadaceae bacterium]